MFFFVFETYHDTEYFFNLGTKLKRGEDVYFGSPGVSE